ncbi:MAG TPA: hypothetical protein VHL78_03880 [Actinomycetota bacterium]|nr:hypothetical protein [Actinomycetota bacterium]
MSRRTRIWRRIERRMLGVVMAAAARILERRLVRAVHRKPTQAF